MDSLANYGSDDEYEDNSGDNMATTSSKNDGGQYYSPEEADANYDEVQMDMSEESNNNNSNEEEDNRRRDYSPRDRDRSRSPNNDSNSRSYDKKSNTNDSRSLDQRASDSRQSDNRPRKQDYRTKYEEDKRYDEDRDRDRSSRRYSEDDRDKRKYDDDRSDRRRYDRKEDNDSKRSPDYREDRRDKRKYRRSSSKERRRSSSRERRRSSSRERRRSTSRDRKRSSSRERRRSRSPRKSRRSRSKERDSGRYPKKFDRTTNKIAQLEKLGIEIKTPDAEFITPQMLLQRSMDEQVQKVKNSTGIELPKYYNPAAMNPARYADQIQKRRLLWQKNTTPGSTSTPTVSQAPVETTKEANNPANRPNMGRIWENTTFAQDSDGKVASKFKRLMGIKEAGPEAANSNREILKKQEEMFSSMEQQYEVARTATHTMRGVGLGFGSYQYPR